MGGTFAAGGSFVITGNGTDGIENGVIFSGAFNCPVAWTLITLGEGPQGQKSGQRQAE